MELAAALVARGLEAFLSQGVSCVLGVASANDAGAWSLVLTNPHSIGCAVLWEDSKANLRSRVCNRVQRHFSGNRVNQDLRSFRPWKHREEPLEPIPDAKR